MGNPKFNEIMSRYFFEHNTYVKSWVQSKYMEAQSDYFDFFSYFLNRYGMAIGVVLDINSST